MEFIRSFSEKTNNYTQKIKDSSFIEGNTIVVQTKQLTYGSLFEVFMKLNEIEYDVLEANQIPQFLTDSKMNLASNITMDDINPKLLSKSLIQNGLLNDNCFSTILYLNQHYKTNCIIHNKQTGNYYQTGLRRYPSFIVAYDSDKWIIESGNSQDISFSPLTDLQTFLTMDIQTNEIYTNPLKGIQTYKLGDLETLATENNIDLRDSMNKKKRKKDLYEEIKLKIIQQPI